MPSAVSDPQRILDAGIANLGLCLPAGAGTRLVRYLRLLRKWNRVFNLTAIDEPERMVTHHLLDSLAILPYVRGPRLLDVGSGAGLPGLVIAIAKPELRCALLDSVGKKTRFLTQAAIELDLHNVEVINGRMEEHRPAARYDTIVARAFAGLDEFCRLVVPLMAPGGILLAMKGADPAREITELRSPGLRCAVHQLHVPGLDAARHLVAIRALGAEQAPVQ